jgi:septal ring factor EnvC (AmiA/AmiB activator)
MTNYPSTSAITQAELDKLLTQLQQLRSSITTARETIAPLETNLAAAYNEFQVEVGALRRQSMRLQVEIASLRSQIQRFTQDEDDTQQQDVGNDNFLYQEEQTTEFSLKDPEAIDKDMLLEHIFRLLNPDVNAEDAELFANLQGLCSDATANLADILEELPWGIVWTTRNSQENLTQQYQRLKVWEGALNRQLQNLKQATERLYKDARYGLWQQQQKSQEHWHNFLNQCIEQQQDQNYELQAELDKLKEEWGRITSTNRL